VHIYYSIDIPHNIFKFPNNILTCSYVFDRSACCYPIH